MHGLRLSSTSTTRSLEDTRKDKSLASRESVGLLQTDKE
jgi:hypothetical protein